MTGGLFFCAIWEAVWILNFSFLWPFWRGSGFDPEITTVSYTLEEGIPSFGIDYTPSPGARPVLIGVVFHFEAWLIAG